MALFGVSCHGSLSVKLFVEDMMRVRLFPSLVPPSWLCAQLPLNELSSPSLDSETGRIQFHVIPFFLQSTQLCWSEGTEDSQWHTTFYNWQFHRVRIGANISLKSNAFFFKNVNVILVICSFPLVAWMSQQILFYTAMPVYFIVPI